MAKALAQLKAIKQKKDKIIMLITDLAPAILVCGVCGERGG